MIEVRNVHRWFGAHHVLQGLDLHIRDGETIVIIGRSGCGKSVLLKHMMGLLQPDEGDVVIDGTSIFSLGTRDQDIFRLKLGMLFQGAALFDSLSVEQNVGFSLYEHTQLVPEKIREVVREKLALVGLAGIEDLMPAALSGGMKKRVGLARAICNEPKIIFYDEPTTGLDPISADAINDLILRMQGQLKVTSVVVTHDMTSAYKVANRIAMLYEGKIVGIGSPEEIKNTQNPIIRQFTTGSARGPITDQDDAS